MSGPFFFIAGDRRAWERTKALSSGSRWSVKSWRWPGTFRAELLPPSWPRITPSGPLIQGLGLTGTDYMGQYPLDAPLLGRAQFWSCRGGQAGGGELTVQGQPHLPSYHPFLPAIGARRRPWQQNTWYWTCLGTSPRTAVGGAAVGPPVVPFRPPHSCSPGSPSWCAPRQRTIVLPAQIPIRQAWCTVPLSSRRSCPAPRHGQANKSG